ncbi:MAG TPA: type II secretion system protein [Candidatus Limnocylindria bacterium]|nr:type II secretion system protein [Candidatus Limnocylindria bacterium]
MTRIELLVVVVIIFLLAGMLMPAVTVCGPPRGTVKCRSNLRSLGVAIQNYELALSHYPWATSNATEIADRTLATQDLDPLFRSLPKPLITTGLLCPRDRRPHFSQHQTWDSAPSNHFAMNTSYFLNVVEAHSGENSASILAGDRNLFLDGSPDFDYRATTLGTPARDWEVPGLPATHSSAQRFDGTMHEFRGQFLYGDGHVEVKRSNRLGNTFVSGGGTNRHGLRLIFPVGNSYELGAASH